MKEKLTFEKICADVAADCENSYKSGIVFVVAIAVVIFFEFFFLALAAFTGLIPLMAVIGVIIGLTVLVEALLCYSAVLGYLHMNRAKNGQLYVVRDVMYRKETVTKYRRSRGMHGGISVRTYKEVYFSAAGKYYSKTIADRIYDNTECGETVYLVYTGVFPNKAVYAYSSGKYEPDFEVKSSVSEA